MIASKTNFWKTTGKNLTAIILVVCLSLLIFEKSIGQKKPISCTPASLTDKVTHTQIR